MSHKQSAVHSQLCAFTLIELSIVLVIIGLIVGGVLVGQNLINASAVRATATQIEKYNTAANTFREKYGYLPGDIPAGPAAQFGFIARGTGRGAGDGNGVIEMNGACCYGLGGGGGEQLVFWTDLSTAHLIGGGFSTATFSSSPGNTTSVTPYLPGAQLGGGNFIYVFSGGWGDNSGTSSNAVNYYGISAVTQFQNNLDSNEGLTVAQAYAIDTKVDDGLPLAGNVLAAYLNGNNWMWAGVGYVNFNAAPPAGAVSPSAATCFDNGGSASNSMKYSVEVSNGANVTCGLTFKMQAGD